MLNSLIIDNWGEGAYSYIRVQTVKIGTLKRTCVYCDYLTI